MMAVVIRRNIKQRIALESNVSRTRRQEQEAGDRCRSIIQKSVEWADQLDMKKVPRK